MEPPGQSGFWGERLTCQDPHPLPVQRELGRLELVTQAPLCVGEGTSSGSLRLARRSVSAGGSIFLREEARMERVASSGTLQGTGPLNMEVLRMI